MDVNPAITSVYGRGYALRAGGGRDRILQRCSEILRVTQPALSNGIAKLESTLGGKLFD